MIHFTLKTYLFDTTSSWLSMSLESVQSLVFAALPNEANSLVRHVDPLSFQTRIFARLFLTFAAFCGVYHCEIAKNKPGCQIDLLLNQTRPLYCSCSAPKLLDVIPMHSSHTSPFSTMHFVGSRTEFKTKFEKTSCQHCTTHTLLI